jgi:hypothetical protein
MDALPGIVCPACSVSVQRSFTFCPSCGKPLRTSPPSTSVSRQIIVYLISFFVAPFGLWFAWKYLKQEDQQSKMIGVAAIVLTIVAVAITVWAMAGLFNSVSQLLNPMIGL